MSSETFELSRSVRILITLWDRKFIIFLGKVEKEATKKSEEELPKRNIIYE